nr:Sec-independent protein translocase protein TatB [Gammaproteobacteria bacterium]
MFNIHSTEIILILVVALIVIGPERLPAAIKTAGLWIGRFRRSFYKVKAEIERELNTDEIRRQLHNESVIEEVEKAKSRLEGIAKETE